MKKNPSFVFFGTPDVASGTLEILKTSGFIPELIVTSIDKPQGRKMIISPSEVKVWAVENNIPMLQPEKLDENFTKSLMTKDYDLFIVVAYGKIIPERILKIPKLGSVNIHYSLLPKYRGASPVEAAILNGEIETGITIQQMAFKMDAGDILLQEKVEIGETETAPELRKRLIKIGGDLLSSNLENIIDGKLTPVAQDESGITFCKKIKKEDGEVHLETDNDVELYNKFRAYYNWPRIFYMYEGSRIIITDAELINGKFQIKKVLPEGRKEIKYEDFIKNKKN